MTNEKKSEPPIEGLLAEAHLADALESDRFKNFLDHIPIGVAVAELHPSERITYANLEFERLMSEPIVNIEGRNWEGVTAIANAGASERPMTEAIQHDDDYIGAFVIEHADGSVVVDAWSNVIESDDGDPLFRLVALAEVERREVAEATELEHRLREKDTLLRELQHRVKNNLQMITALIRLETRNLPEHAVGERFERLAGRVESLALLYRSLSDEEGAESVDLGIYLCQIASAVMKAHAVEGIRLDLKVDSWPVSINVAMPTGLVVNEVLTNALKHAFAGREGGTITLHGLVDEDGCRIIVADDGIGLQEGSVWPQSGKLAALIVRSLKQNAKAKVDVRSAPGEGVHVSIYFARDNSAPRT